jgi:hypothetical protein
MPDSLADLEARRAAVQMQIAQLGDMRSGSITGTGGRCGNPNCHCHRAGDPGHGPYYRLTRKVNGKTVTETFSSAASLTKAQREVAECQRFRQLGEQLLDVNEQICELRPVTEISPTALEKNGGSHPARDHARSKPTVACDSQRPTPSGTSGTGGHRDVGALRHAPCWGNGPDQTAAVPSPGDRPVDHRLLLWLLSALSGTALQTGPDRGGQGGSVAPLLLVPALSYRPLPRRCRTGH